MKTRILRLSITLAGYCVWVALAGGASLKGF